MRPDVTIVGAGMAGLHCAYPLVEAGLYVLMLDAGHEPKKKFGLRYPLLGRNAGYATTKIKNGRIITESFVAGGMSEIWGGACARFDAEELRETGLPALDEHYDIVSKRIGLKGGFSDYRGHTTLEELKRHPNFEYRKEMVYEIPHLSKITVLACGAIGTAKLLRKTTKFYKGSRLSICLSPVHVRGTPLRPAREYSVGRSYFLVYPTGVPFVVIADVRGPRIPLRKERLLPLLTVQMPEGSTSHYAGGVEVDNDGKYADSLYVADASGWRALPAKPIGLTIMANANRIGTGIAQRFKASKFNYPAEVCTK